MIGRGHDLKVVIKELARVLQMAMYLDLGGVFKCRSQLKCTFKLCAI